MKGLFENVLLCQNNLDTEFTPAPSCPQVEVRVFRHEASSTNYPNAYRARLDVRVSNFSRYITPWPIGHSSVSIGWMLFQVHGPAPNNTMWLELSFAHAITYSSEANVNWTFASGSDKQSDNDNRIVYGLEGTQSLKSPTDNRTFSVCQYCP